MQKWIFRALGIIVIAAGILFIIHFCRISAIYEASNTLGLNVLLVIMAIAAAGGTAWCIFSKSAVTGRIKVLKTALLLLSAAVMIVNTYIYVQYLPKVGQDTACMTVKKDLNLSNITERLNGGLLLWYPIRGNPFLKLGYVLEWESADRKSGLVYYDPAGRYEYSFNDDTQITTACFTTSTRRNIYVSQNGAVSMNLYFNKSGGNPLVSDCIANGGWTSKVEMDYHTNEQCLPQKEIELFMLNLGEAELREQLNDTVQRYLQYYNQVKTKHMPEAADLSFQIRLYGYDIASCRNSSITLFSNAGPG